MSERAEGRHDTESVDEAAGDLSDQFVARMISAWTNQTLPADTLADAMLAAAVNLLGALHGREEVVRVLRELAASVERSGSLS